MNKQRSQQYKVRVDQAIATPKLQKALHQFGDAYMVSRGKAFAGLDFEALRSEIATMKDGVRVNHAALLQQFIQNAEAAGGDRLSGENGRRRQQLYRRAGKAEGRQAGG